MSIRENDVISEVIIGKEKSVFKNKEKSTMRFFYHMPISEDDRNEEIRHGLSEVLSAADSAADFADVYEWYGSVIGRLMRSAEHDICYNTANIIENLKITESYIDTSFKIDEAEDPIFVHIDIDKNRNGIGSKDTIIFTYKDEKFTDILDLVYKICYDPSLDEDDDDDDEYDDYSDDYYLYD